MQQDSNPLRQWGRNIRGQLKCPRPPRQMTVLVAGVLTFATLACGFIEASPRLAADYIILTRLPTLTRTPLPLLTPTSEPASVVVAPASGSLETTPILASQPEDSPANGATPPASWSLDAGADASAAPVSANVSHEVGLADRADSSLALETPVLPAGTPASASPITPEETAVPTAPSGPPLLPPGSPAPTPSDTPTPTPTAVPVSDGWVFSNVRMVDQGAGTLLLYGEATNDSGSSQDLWLITGTFYDAQGLVLSNEDLFDYWPIETVPAGGRIPFELTVTGVQNVAGFDLHVQAVPSDKTLRQDFEVFEVDQASSADNYCLTGAVRNPGGQLQDYLAVIAVLYDGQDNVVNFSDYYHYSPQDLVGDQALSFAVCVDPLDQDIARYELRPWGL